VLFVGMVKVSESLTLRRVARFKSLGFNLLLVSHLLDEFLRTISIWVLLVCWILEVILCA
jgi:hypothetical protein